MKPNPIISVLLVEDSPLVRYGVRAAIENEANGPQVRIVGEAETASAALKMAPVLAPDVILLDLRLPDDSGINICRRLKEILPDSCVIILTSATDSQSVYDSVLAGAHGFLHKDIDAAGLIKAIVDGKAGKPVLSAHASTNILSILTGQSAQTRADSKLDKLSPQERRVLEAIAAGNTNKEIGHLLKLSENTIKNYIVNLFKKLGVERRSKAVAIYLGSLEKPGRPSGAR